MSSRLERSWRIFPFAVLAGLAVVAGQSCDERSRTSEQRAVTPGSGGVGPQAVPDAAAVPGNPADPANVDGIDAASAPRPCEEGGNECGEGFLCCPRCCIAGLKPVCVQAVDGKCPLPDLSVNEGALAMSPQIETIEATPCEVDEGCVAGPGKRRVLRFDVGVPNGGNADLVLGNPDAGGPFQYATCHKHYHFTNFAHYELFDADGGASVVVGRKQAFCAQDSARVDRGAARMPRYDCTQQGIQIGWEDLYPANLPCQYIDITGVPAGTYRLQVEVNRERAITEMNYDNNLSSVQVDIP